MKRLVALILVCSTLFFTVSGSFAETLEKTSVKITYNGVRTYLMDSDDNQLPIYLEEGHFYIPLDSFIQAIGGEYKYDADTNTVSIELSNGFTSAPAEKKITQEVFDSAKLAYQKLVTISNETANIMDDIYNAWRYGIYESDSATLSDFVSELHLSSTEIEAALNDHIYMLFGDHTPTDLFDLFKYSDNFWQECVSLVLNAYALNGRYDLLNTELATAKDALKIVGDQFSDYQYYPNLKNFYAKASSYLEFANNPTGSFNQLKTTISDYENSLRTLITDLSFVFE